MGLFNFTIENSTHNTVPWKYNKDYWSSFELYPDWASREYYGFKGIAHHRQEYWTGTMVIVKTFRHKTGDVASWDTYKLRCDVARNMCSEFNKHLESISSNTRIYFTKPIDAMMENISDVMKITRVLMRFDKRFAEKEVVLFEDLLEGDFNCFVTACGGTTHAGSDILDAFCHYSYDTSAGNLVLCNLKGVEEDGRYSLTNPTIHSVSGCHGETDKGVSGINTFFDNHICNAMCEQFMKPDFLCRTPSAPSLSSINATYSKSRDNDVFEADQSKPPQYTAIYPDGPPSTITPETIAKS